MYGDSTNMLAMNQMNTIPTGNGIISGVNPLLALQGLSNGVRNNTFYFSGNAISLQSKLESLSDA